MFTFEKKILIIGLAVITAGSLHAGRGLVEHSPFLPPDFNPGRSNAPAAQERPSTPIERQLEFKGWYEINGEVRILISQRQQGGGGWMRIGESRDSISILDFDSSQEQVRARYQNSEGWLSLAKLESNPSGSGSSSARDRRAAASSQEDARSTATRPVRTVGNTSRTSTSRSPTPQRRTVSSARISGSSPGEPAEPPAGAPQNLPGAQRSGSGSGNGSGEGGGSTASGDPGSSADQRPSGTPPTQAPSARPDTDAVENIAVPRRRR
ncbi:MAG: hypothetical protein JJU20_11825 [Opitutales bacterium]|nr:hypothetical protein [Opitutales bacterium]